MQEPQRHYRGIFRGIHESVKFDSKISNAHKSLPIGCSGTSVYFEDLVICYRTISNKYEFPIQKNFDRLIMLLSYRMFDRL